MAKSVLISIRPQWVEKIFNGSKTIEVRRTFPKQLETPFEVLVYETKGQFIKSVKGACTTYGYGRGKVIGSFVCDKVYKIVPDGEYYSNGYDIDDDMLSEMCLGRGYLTGYGLGYTLYGWHISDLKIYDKPKKLRNFGKKIDRFKRYSSELGMCSYECGECEYFDYPDNPIYETGECCADRLNNGICPLIRPPQSWCYVEDKKEVWKYGA